MQDPNQLNDAKAPFDRKAATEDSKGSPHVSGKAVADADADEGSPESTRDGSFKVFDRRFWQSSAEDSEDQPERDEVPSYVKQLQQQLEKKEAQLQEYIAAYKKEVVEELEQSKERLERDHEQQVQQLRGEMATPMMAVLEALERSVDAARSSKDAVSLTKGVEMVHMLMLQKLRELGLERIDTVGTLFDPKIHDAVAIQPVTDTAQNNVIVAEFSPGFLLEGRVVRAAKVQVGKLAS